MENLRERTRRCENLVTLASVSGLYVSCPVEYHFNIVTKDTKDTFA